MKKRTRVKMQFVESKLVPTAELGHLLEGDVERQLLSYEYQLVHHFRETKGDIGYDVVFEYEPPTLRKDGPIRFLRSALKISDGSHISRAPGSTVSSIAEFICSRETFNRIVKPVVADIQHEYFEALAKGRKSKAVWVWIRGLCSFWLALGVFRLAKTAAQVWKRVNLF